jgi:hypothetical protein
MIHCIGDSHSSVFSGNEEMQPIWPERSNDITEYFNSYRIGPATAYQLNNKKEIINQIIPLIKTNDKLLFCFGEVDIRAHLLKKSTTQNIPIEDVVIECVSRYVEVINYYKSLNLSVIVWGPIASWNDDKPYLGGPSFGSNIERNNATKLFNKHISNQLKKYDIPFVTIFEDMLNEDGTTNQELLDDWQDCHIHLNQKAMPLIIKAFKEQNLL